MNTAINPVQSSDIKPLAILLCMPAQTNESQAVPFADRSPSFMLQMVDRPMLQQCIESLRYAGIEEVRVLTTAVPEQVKALLGDGTRWGCKITHHFVQDLSNPIQTVFALDIARNRPLLLAQGDVALALNDVSSQPIPSVLVGADHGAHGDPAAVWLWTDLTSLQNHRAPPLPSDWGKLCEHPDWHVHPTDAPALSNRTGHAWLASQAHVLSKRFPAQVAGFEIEPGVWLSRNVVLHPTAQITSPVYLGEDCRIDDGVKIGPNVVISHTTRIGNGTELTNACVESGTWLGENLTCNDLLMRPTYVWNAMLNVALTIKDNFLLARLQPRRTPLGWVFHSALRLFSRCLALLLWLVTWPLHFAYRIAHPERKAMGDVILLNPGLRPSVTEAVQANPVSYPSLMARQSEGWGHLLGWFLPGLWHIAMGHWHWVGVPPRASATYHALDEDWRSAILKSKLGLVDEGWVEFGSQAQEWEQRISELYYVSQRGNLLHDLQLLLHYPATLLRQPNANLGAIEDWS